MDKDFSLEYSKRSDAELLQLATDSASLTAQADASLTDELRRRNLKNSDLAKHQRFVRRHEQLDSKRRRRKVFGRWDVRTWIELLPALLVIFLISAAYSELPSQYHLKPDWEEAAEQMMWASVLIAVCPFNRRTVTFWVSLIVSSSVHLVVVHAWILRSGKLTLIQDKQAPALGFVFFLVLYFIFWVVRRKFFRDEARDSP